MPKLQETPESTSLICDLHPAAPWNEYVKELPEWEISLLVETMENITVHRRLNKPLSNPQCVLNIVSSSSLSPSDSRGTYAWKIYMKDAIIVQSTGFAPGTSEYATKLRAETTAILARLC
jgi:hypothetical protein